MSLRDSSTGTIYGVIWYNVIFVWLLQAEVIKLQQALDTEKQLFEIKLHKTTIELRQKR